MPAAPASSIAPSLDPLGPARDNVVLAAAVALQLAVLGWDAVTPIGRTEWVFHLLPVAMLLLQQRVWVPLAMVASGCAALAIGYQLSPPAVTNAELAVANRVMGAVCLLALGGVMTATLRQRQQMRRLLWVQQGKVTLNLRAAGDGSPDDVGARIVRALCEVTGARVGALYRVDGARLRLCGQCAADTDSLRAELPLHGGLLGQVVQNQRVQAISPAPEGHLSLQSALGSSAPAHLVLVPLRGEGVVQGVAELGFSGSGDSLPLVVDLCERAADPLGLALRAAQYRVELQSALEESRRQAEQLQLQQEELRASNEELEAQTRLLRESQAALEVEHQALMRSNARLEVQTQSLEHQKTALERSAGDLQHQTEALATASRYKTEFLANMSHELRTPLNSALILSRLLAENRGGTLTGEQVQYAQAIHDANNDLLALINDILDLTKVEAGRAELKAETVRLADVVARLRATFDPIAREKKLSLSFTQATDAPDTLITDSQRLQQVLKNLLANALKFTRQGSVALHIGRTAEGGVRLDVIDTGLGIAPDQHQIIFEAFRQADGSTSRQYGGTGLGLSISRELVQRLGGVISLRSVPGQGSTFTVQLPLKMPAPDDDDRAAPGAAASTPESPKHHPATRRVLVVEDDADLRNNLRALLAAPQVEVHTAGTVAEARERLSATRFDCVVTDLALPDGSGEALFERMAAAEGQAFPPVIVYTGRPLSREAEMRLRRYSRSIIVKGARSPQRLLDEVRLVMHSGQVQPPDDQRRMPSRSRERDAVLEGRTVLLAEDDVRNVFALTSLFEHQGVRLVVARNGREAVEAVERQPGIDLVLMDIMMPEMDGLEAMRRIRAQPEFVALPMIALTAKAMADDRQQCLAAGASDYLAKPIDPQRLLSLCRLWMPK